MKNILILFILFFSEFFYADNHILTEYNLYNAYKKEYMSNPYIEGDPYEQWFTKIETKYINKWIKLPPIINKMIIDDNYIKDVVYTLKKQMQKKNTSVILVHVTAFKLMPHNHLTALKLMPHNIASLSKSVRYKAEIVENFTDINSTGKEIIFTYLVSSREDVPPDLLASDNIVVLKNIDGVWYINSYLIFPPKKEILNILRTYNHK